MKQQPETQYSAEQLRVIAFINKQQAWQPSTLQAYLISLCCCAFFGLSLYFDTKAHEKIQADKPSAKYLQQYKNTQ